MTPAEFAALMQPIMRAVAGKPIDAMLAEHLNTIFPPVGDTFQRIKAACHEAIREGWMCSQEPPAGDLDASLSRAARLET